MENARLVRWLKRVGDLVRQGEPLLELETEKSVVEIEATESGRLVEILLDADREVRVGDQVGWLESEEGAESRVGGGTDRAASGARAGQGGAAEAGAARGAASGGGGSQGAVARGAGSGGGGSQGAVARGAASGAGGSQGGGARGAAGQESVASQVGASRAAVSQAGAAQSGAAQRAGSPSAVSGAAVSQGSVFHGGGSQAGGAKLTGAPPLRATGRIKSSPVARRLAAEHALDLREVDATGPRGRIQLSDVRRAIEARQGAGGGLGRAGGEPGLRALSSMRRAVARAMTLSNATVPQFVVERAVDWTNLRGVRAELVAGLPAGAPKPSVNDFLLQAIARSLLAFPQLNATFSGDVDSPDAALLVAKGTHIGLVVAVENGLLVPVLHDVERLGLAELAGRRSETVQRALSGKLKRDELEGATFSLSNLGARGPDRFAAIISPPQSAILAVGRERECVVALQGGIHVRPMSQLTLTVDHRVADGRLAADFLASVVEVLEGSDWRLTSSGGAT